MVTYLVARVSTFVYWVELFFFRAQWLLQIKPGFLSILVPFSVLSIIGSSYLSTKISSTLRRLENIINEFIEVDSVNVSDLKKQIELINNKHNEKEKGEKFEIYEVEKLSRFIVDSIN